MTLETVAIVPDSRPQPGTRADVLTALRCLTEVPDVDVRREVVVRLLLLGGLRYDEIELLKLVEERSMVTLDDLRTSSFYQFIVEEGMEEGRHEGVAALLRRQLERRFGPLPSWAVERITNADRTTVEAWGDRVVDAVGTSLDELLS